MSPAFIPGVQLSERLYREAVHPLLSRHFPELPHTAALIGPGSEVLGFDTARSTDHDWGPRLQLFVRTDAERVSEALAEHLPATIAGFPTNLVPVGDHGTRHMRPVGEPGERIRHGVVVTDLGSWLMERLGFDPRNGVGTRDWLATPTQVLAEITGGAVFHDGLAELEPVRRRLAWYPDDVWRYALACQWQRISQEEPFVGRCAEVGDELGSAVVAARLVRDLMRLCLLLNRIYPPYSKWLGSAFARLPCAEQLTPVLTAALTGEHHLAAACEAVAALHNASGLTEPLDTRTRPFHDRPYRVLGAERFAEALMAGTALGGLPLTGTVDQIVDNTDVLAHPARWRVMTGRW
ncbi:DUF4037 domain-containing protein [Allokutzneria sp. A3M-2-11 16]|uniref:DUF4037 domain-containing protein n=1 Tax=Allokutzneria sp. A3M-2-11 16 TaxID=2962043 RepID=UPI0020B70E96|nr:DUF4037 domain-containing protein [Allokutzneria sp. A3M-2-11 16]MCP3805591.1 DUF4037 domain-containing protein [Allokutzneria sp. A3M-2-11 16]